MGKRGEGGVETFPSRSGHIEELGALENMAVQSTASSKGHPKAFKRNVDLRCCQTVDLVGRVQVFRDIGGISSGNVQIGKSFDSGRV